MSSTFFRPFGLLCQPDFGKLAARFYYLPVGLAVLGGFALVGCDQPDPIRSYTVSTRVPDQLKPSAQRMIAAMVPLEDQVWFFKILGPKPAVDSIESVFRDFVAGVAFDDGEPELTDLPDRWQRAGEKPFRFASINIDTADKQLDLSISQLELKADWDNQVMENVNRWRGQVGLEASTEHWAGGEALEVTATDQPAIWVDLIGDASDASMTMSPPFANMGGGAGMTAGTGQATAPSDPHAGLPQEARDQIAAGTAPAVGPVSAGATGGSETAAVASEPAEEGGLKYDRPEGWRDGRMSMMRLAAFNVGPEDATAEVTVMSAGGDLKSNVARWMGQAGIPMTDEGVDKAMTAAESLEVSGRSAQRFILISEDETSEVAIDGTVIPLPGGYSMFVKMTGPPATIKEQQEQMGSFLESLSF